MSLFYSKEYKIGHAESVILDTYGDTVSVDEKKKDLIKFGRNSLTATTGSTIMTLPPGVDHETFVSTNAITTVSSASTSDTTQTLTVEGHTISGSDLTFVVQTIALTGQSQATLTTPLARITRAYVSSGSSNIVGAVYFYENDTSSSGVPDTPAKVHMMIPAGKNQTVKCSTSLSSVDYWIITGFKASVLTKTASYADIELQVRNAGGVFRVQELLQASNTNNGVWYFDPYLIVRPNSDIRLVATASTSNLDVSGSITGYLAIIL